MSIFRSLFNKTKPNFDTDEKALQMHWDAYKSTLSRKKELLDKAYDHTVIVEIRKQLKIEFVDVEQESKTLDEEVAEIDLRTHARNIRSAERLYTALYDTDTIHDYLHALLTHLYTVLQRQWQLIDDLERQAITADGFIQTFTKQLEDEQHIVETINTYLKSFTKLLHEMLSRKKTADIIDRRIEATASNYREQFRQCIYQHETTNRLASDIDEISQILQDEAQRMYDNGEIHENEVLTERMHDIDIWIVNQPGFRKTVKYVLEKNCEGVTSDDITAITAIYREYINEFGMPVPRRRIQ